MIFEEALRKYSIPIPSDIYDYDKEIFSEFDNMYLRSFYETFYSEQRYTTLPTNAPRIAVVLGGQTGAGKGSLVAETKREFMKNGRRIVLIDDDSYRHLYPYSDEILKNCPEWYTRLTASATSKITPKILKFASDKGYNFIFDGTMKNSRIIETMKSWNGYDIQAKILACSRLRSLLSIAIRNGELQRIGTEGRFISIDSHDETYKGIPDTLQLLEKEGVASEIRIYTRGIDPIYPILRYSSLTSKERSYDTLIKLREEDEKLFLQSAETDCEYLSSLSLELSEREQEEAEKILKLVRGRIQKKGER